MYEFPLFHIPNFIFFFHLCNRVSIEGARRHNSYVIVDFKLLKYRILFTKVQLINFKIQIK